MVAVDVSIGGRGDDDRADLAYASGIDRHEVFPHDSLPGGQIEAKDFSGKVARAVDLH